ncbi:MAG: D-aminoacyl-tRNA deacylase [Planctomycetota bacterium]
MRAVIQRVSQASVQVDGTFRASTGPGLLVYLGVGRDDGEPDIAFLTDKIRHLRIFSDEAGRLNLDVMQARGQVLVVSAFTVQADARHGRRPSFDDAAEQDRAFVLYQLFCDALAKTGVPVSQGVFGGYMQVHAVNDGPICILLESRKAF